MALFHKNAVITGLLDSYCLQCEVHLKGEQEIRRHIQTPEHKEILASTNYVKKYEDDGIRKVKQGYYCEYCNKLFATLIKTDMHVSETGHKNKKHIQQLQLKDNVIVAFNKIAFDEDAWHGLVGQSCALCNEDVLDKEAHKTTSAHVLHLVQSDIELDSDGAVYRKGDNFFYCLICNGLFALNTVQTHLKSADHLKHFDNCCESYVKRTAKENLNDINASEITEIACGTKDSNVNAGNVAAETTSNEQALAACGSRGSKQMEANQSAAQENEPDVSGGEMENAIDDKNESKQQNTVTVSSLNKDKEAPEKIQNKLEGEKKYAETNKLRYNEGTSSVFCTICNVTISSSLKRMKQHVNRTTHRQIAERVSETLSRSKILSEFRDQIYYIQSLVLQPNGLSVMKEVVISKSFRLTSFGFLVITKNQTLFRCHLCEVNFDHNSLSSHCALPKHAQALFNTRVLCSLFPEFVREIRPGLYHCGFCNILEGSWGGLMDHLKSTTHSGKKAFASRKLQEHLPDIKKREFEKLLLHCMLNGVGSF